ncbi:DUF1996 domain-containing protein [Pseudozyma hubeiensis]|nr:DUF1996 domain-containing protein [Pseudozyma hubeiensis]
MLKCIAGVSSLVALLVIVLIAQPAAARLGFFILSHGRIKTSRVDPIVSPGQLSSHVHNFVGMNGIDANTTTVELLDEASTCSSAPLTDDRSSYWAPQLYRYNSTADTFNPVGLSFVNTYYLMRGTANITAFPRGLKMVAGNAKATGPDTNPQLRGVASFVCLNYVNGSTGGSTLPQTTCPQGLRTQVMFPSCWNGESLYQKDMSHVIYPNGDIGSGDCPASHSIRLPTLFYEYIWDVGNTNNEGNSSWVLANGDAFGYSFHADFFANWNETTLQDAIDDCSGDLFGDIEKCPALARTVDRKAASACRGQSTEPLSAALASLPGCNIVYNGPHAGRGLSPGCDPSKVANMPAGGVLTAKPSSRSTATRSGSTAKLRTTKTSTRSRTTSHKISGSVTLASSRPKTTSTKKLRTKTKKKHKTTSTRRRHHATRLPNSH